MINPLNRSKSIYTSSSFKMILLFLAIHNVVSLANPQPLEKHLKSSLLEQRNLKEDKTNDAKKYKKKDEKKDLFNFFTEMTKVLDSDNTSATEIPTSSPSHVPSTIPTSSPTDNPTLEQVIEPMGVQDSDVPSISPTMTPSIIASNLPTEEFTMEPTAIVTKPTDPPTKFPVLDLSKKPTGMPDTLKPTEDNQGRTTSTASPTVVQSSNPSSEPSSKPSVTASSSPSETNSEAPTTSLNPSNLASGTPSTLPSSSPSVNPSDISSMAPTLEPSLYQTVSPSETASTIPSIAPTRKHSLYPTISPSENPSETPSISHVPTNVHSMVPSSYPTSSPSIIPTNSPSISAIPTLSGMPSNIPSSSSAPTNIPSTAPTTSMTPTIVISSEPTSFPSEPPTVLRSENPSAQGSEAPSSSSGPTVAPSLIPSFGPSVKSSDHPSLQPSKMESQEPSSSTPSWCKDSTEDFTIDSGEVMNCESVAGSSGESCKIPGVKTKCPVTCGYCLCTDNAKKFTIENGNNKNCKFIGKNTKRCSPKGRYNCPLTCGRCITESPSMQPSGSPSESVSPTKSNVPSTSPSMIISEEPSVSLSPSSSAVPTTLRSLVDVNATIALKMGPVIGSTMSEQNKKLLQDTLEAWFSTIKSKPEFFNIQTTILNQNLRQLTNTQQRALRRQLLESGDYILLFDLFVTGQFKPIGVAGQPGSITTAAEANVEGKLKTLFSNSTNSDALILALTNNTSSAADYFSALSEIAFTNNDPNSIGTPVEKGDNGFLSFWDNNRIIIVASAAGGGLILILIVSLFVFGKSRRNRLNQNTSEEITDPEIFATSTSQKEINRSWEDVQPTQPYPQTTDFGMDVDDEGTDGGRTFNTLEKIYSGESGDQMSFQSYGYSLDDGIMSNQSQTPSSDKGTISLVEATKPDFDRDSVDISLASPGDSSVFSGLTNEDTSLKQILKANLPQGKVDVQDNASVEEDPLDSYEEERFERVCTAPPGKLGVVIDTTKLGPVVYQVKDESPLKGIVFPGDRIIGVDDIDTRGMTASNITKIMARKAEMQRRITVSSKKNLNNESGDV